MPSAGLDRIAVALSRLPRTRQVARIASVRAGQVTIEGAMDEVGVGHQFGLARADADIRGEVVAVDGRRAQLVLEGDCGRLSVGDAFVHRGPLLISPGRHWIGRIVDSRGRPLDGKPMVSGLEAREIAAEPPAASQRRGLGQRLETGMSVFNTFLPIVRGQRLGLFAGSGVGKSTLLGTLSRDLQADVAVIALVGERGREVGAFVRHILGKPGMTRSVVVAETSDRSAIARRRAAFSAMAVAEHFRDEGAQVLLVVDSVTRLAEAQREIASAAGEPPSFRGYPPSLIPMLAGLAERAGPGTDGQGDITAVLSVLVAGSDMDEPVSDTLRGLLDGHIVLSREIAERGRFPAVDVLKSVSRALPAAATAEENALLKRARQTLALYEESEIMIRSGLYQAGASADLDEAVMLYPGLEQFVAERSGGSVVESFGSLRAVLDGTHVLAGPASLP